MLLFCVQFWAEEPFWQSWQVCFGDSHAACCRAGTSLAFNQAWNVLVSFQVAKRQIQMHPDPEAIWINNTATFMHLPKNRLWQSRYIQNVFSRDQNVSDLVTPNGQVLHKDSCSQWSLGRSFPGCWSWTDVTWRSICWTCCTLTIKMIGPGKLRGKKTQEELG